MADPREGVTPEGLILTGARRDPVPSAFEPVLAYVLGRVPPEVSVHVYGSVANGTAVVPVSDVDLLTIGLPAAEASGLGAEASATFAGLCRGVEIAAVSSDDYLGEGDEAYGNRVFLRHYCVHLAGPDPGAGLPGFPADARAARGFNGDIDRSLRRWRAALGGDDAGDLSRRIARKSLLAVAGLVSVHDGTWTTDRSAAATRWSQVEPSLASALARLETLSETGGASAGEASALLGSGGVIEQIVTRFASDIGLWAG